MKDSGNKSAPKNKFLGEKNCEWIGEIPDDKKLIRNKFIFHLQKGKIPLSQNSEGIGLPYIGASDIESNKYLNYTEDISVPTCNPEDILILWDGARAGLIGTGKKGAISSTMVKCWFENTVFPKFGYWYFKGFEPYFMSQVHGTTIPHMNSKYIEDIFFIDWSLDEQKKIADYLDDRCSKIDEIITGTTASIEDYKKLKQAIITEAVTKGLNKNVPSNNLVLDWCNTGIRDDWQISQIRYLFKLRSEKNYKPLKEVNLISLYTDKGVIQHSDLEQTTGNRAVTADGYKLVYPDDIVVNIILCWMGAIGRSEYQGVTSPAYDVYEPIDKNNVCSRYYHYLFRTNNFAGKCYTLGRGIMMMRWRTYSSEFRSIKVPVPPLSEQKEIANYLDKKIGNIDDIITEKTGLIEDLKAYKKSLIYEVVTGKKRIK